MSSIRPLATITVLASVFVFLYMKINETEPMLPAGVGDWQIDQDVQIGGDFGASPPAPQFAVDAPTQTAAPAFTPTPPTDGAPQFGASPATSASVAPAWPAANAAAASTAPLGVPPTLGDTSAAPGATVPLDVPDLPPLPTLPPAAGSTTNSAELGHPAATQTPTMGVDMQQAQSSLFSATRLAMQAALDRGEMSQALLLLSDWYGDPSLSPGEAAEVQQLLSQLAGSVIYSTEHRLEPPYIVQAGERLEDIAKKYQVPWQLLAKINGINQPNALQPGEQLKMIRGPFSAVVDFSQRRLTLMLDRRYAGQFSIGLDPSISVEEGHWVVSQKLLTPGNVALAGVGPTTPTEERSLMLTNATGGASQIAILRGRATPTATDPVGRVIRLEPSDVEDVYDILSLGSQVVIRR